MMKLVMGISHHTICHSYHHDMSFIPSDRKDPAGSELFDLLNFLKIAFMKNACSTASLLYCNGICGVFIAFQDHSQRLRISPQLAQIIGRQGDALSEVYVAGMGCAMIFALWATFAAFFNFLGLTLGESTK